LLDIDVGAGLDGDRDGVARGHLIGEVRVSPLHRSAHVTQKHAPRAIAGDPCLVIGLHDPGLDEHPGDPELAVSSWSPAGTSGSISALASSTLTLAATTSPAR